MKSETSERSDFSWIFNFQFDEPASMKDDLY